MKKIMFYINTIRHGGAERVITNLAHDLSDEYEVVLVTTLKAEDEYSLAPQVKRYVLESELIEDSRIKKNISRIRNLRAVCKKEMPDVLISFMAEPNYRAILATRGLGIKTIISVRNDPSREYAGKMGRLLAKHLLVYADGCVFQTEQAKEWFPKRLQDKSEIIFNAVSESLYEIEHNPVGKRVVTCGRLEPQKNHELLIKSFAEVSRNISDVVLLIYGKGSEQEELEVLINELNISDRVFLMGTTDEIPKVLSEATLFVLSSDYEGMPNALMEALTIGVPCISTDCPCGGPQMLINDEENGLLVSVNSQDQMVRAMTSVLLNDEFAKKLGKNARATSMEYHPKKVISEWKTYIEDIINGF